MAEGVTGRNNDAPFYGGSGIGESWGLRCGQDIAVINNAAEEALI